MWKDDIVEEVRRVREEFAARFDYDLDAMFRYLKAQEEKHKNRVVSFQHKKVVRPKRRRRPIKKAA